MLLAKSLTSCLAYPNNPLLALCGLRLVCDMMKYTEWLLQIVSGHKNFKAGDKIKVFSCYKVVLHLHRHSKKLKDNFNSCGRHLFCFFFFCYNSGGVVLQALKGRIHIQCWPFTDKIDVFFKEQLSVPFLSQFLIVLTILKLNSIQLQVVSSARYISS